MRKNLSCIYPVRLEVLFGSLSHPVVTGPSVSVHVVSYCVVVASVVSLSYCVVVASVVSYCVVVASVVSYCTVVASAVWLLCATTGQSRNPSSTTAIGLSKPAAFPSGCRHIATLLELVDNETDYIYIYLDNLASYLRFKSLVKKPRHVRYKYKTWTKVWV